MSYALQQRHKRRNAFTLVELLIVVAVISVLAGMVLTVGGSIRNKARITKGQGQFVGIINAMSRYYANYGHYPPIDNFQSTGVLSLAGGATAGDNSKNLIQALSGLVEPDGVSKTGDSSLIGTKMLNPRSISFYTFRSDQIHSVNGTLVDVFGNEDIYMLWDHDGDGVIKIDTSILSTSRDVRARMVMLSKRGDDDAIFTWQ